MNDATKRTFNKRDFIFSPFFIEHFLRPQFFSTWAKIQECCEKRLRNFKNCSKINCSKSVWISLNVATLFAGPDQM